MNAFETITYEKKGVVAYVCLNRPKVLNIHNTAMRDDLYEVLSAIIADGDIGVVIFHGAGEKAFCVGADLKEATNEQAWTTYMSFLQTSNPTVINSQIWKPTIAAINGYALAGGCEYALACDIRILSEDARIGLVEARVGLGANHGSQLLPRMLPLGIALEQLFTGEPLTAQEAYRWGLANQVVPLPQLITAAEDMANRILQCAPLSVRRMKENAMKGLTMPLAHAFLLNTGPDVYSSRDRIEGAAAFAEKRKPKWEGR